MTLLKYFWLKKRMYIFNKSYLKVVEKKEKEVQKYIVSNWQNIFPNLILIKEEYTLSNKIIRISKKTSGRIDLLALDKKTKRFVVIEIKAADEGDYVISQATDYSESIIKNFDSVYLDVLSNKFIDLPHIDEIDNTQVDVIILVTGIDKESVNKKFNLLKNPPIFISYKFLTSLNSQEDFLTLEIHSHNNEFEDSLNSYLKNLKVENKIIETKKTEKIQIGKKIKQNKSISTIQFPKLDTKKIRADKNFKGFIIAYNFRRWAHMFDFFDSVVKFPIESIVNKLNINESQTFEEGFIVYRSAKASFYVFVKPELVVDSNELEKAYANFKKKNSVYYDRDFYSKELAEEREKLKSSKS